MHEDDCSTLIEDMFREGFKCQTCQNMGLETASLERAAVLSSETKWRSSKSTLPTGQLDNTTVIQPSDVTLVQEHWSWGSLEISFNKNVQIMPSTIWVWMQVLFVLGLPNQMVVTDVAKGSKKRDYAFRKSKGVSRYTSCVVKPAVCEMNAVHKRYCELFCNKDPIIKGLNACLFKYSCTLNITKTFTKCFVSASERNALVLDFVVFQK